MSSACYCYVRVYWDESETYESEGKEECDGQRDAEDSTCGILEEGKEEQTEADGLLTANDEPTRNVLVVACSS